MKQGMALAKIDSFDTERLTLRLMTESEWDLFVYNVMAAHEFYITFATEKSEEVLALIEKPLYHKVIYYSIYLPDTDAMIGYVGFSTDSKRIEYCIFTEYRRRGYAYEVVSRFVDFLCSGIITGNPIRAIHAWTVLENEPSMRLLYKMGFRKSGFGIINDGTLVKNFSYEHYYMEEAA